MKLEESSRRPLGLELSESLVGWRWASRSSLPIDAGGMVVGSCSGGTNLLHREKKEIGIACFPGLATSSSRKVYWEPFGGIVEKHRHGDADMTHEVGLAWS